MYAIIETGGKQHRVREGESIDVERLDGEVGDQVFFDRVMLAGDEAGVEVGRPLLEGARVVGSITGQERGGKIIVFKFKRRKGYRRKNTHRQLFTRVRIDQIELKNGTERKAVPEKTKPKAAAAQARPAAKAKKKKSARKKPAAKAARKSAVRKAPSKTAKKAAKTRKTAAKKKK